MMRQLYMVEFEIPENVGVEFFSLVPEQRNDVNELFRKDKLISYSLSIGRDKLWAIFNAATESELLYLIENLPLTPFMTYNYHELLFHDAPHMQLTMSLN